MTNQSIKSTINFMYFANNFPHDWIELVWSDNPHMGRHLQEKWHALTQSNEFGGTLNFFRLFMQLDDSNKTTLLTWIEENYKN